VSRLTARLKDGGVLLIIDFDEHAPESPDKASSHTHSHSHAQPHDHSHGHSHHDHGSAHDHHSHQSITEPSNKAVGHAGFSKQQMSDLLTSGGLADVAVQDLAKDFVFVMPASLFSGGQGKREIKRDIFMARGIKRATGPAL
jgi:hypothetical protein